MIIVNKRDNMMTYSLIIKRKNSNNKKNFIKKKNRFIYKYKITIIIIIL